MKYMGSKRVMLQNGLGSMIQDESKKAKRIVDLFCGSGSVAGFAAHRTNLPILAIDLQKYSVVLAESFLGRTAPFNPKDLELKWLSKIKDQRESSSLWKKAENLTLKIDKRSIRRYVEECRLLCGEESNIGPIWNSYGGHYFSPEQALTFDYMLRNLPEDKVENNICRAATIIAAMRCIAAPGHTAQPFQPTRTAKKFIIESWKRDPLDACKKALEEVCPLHVKTLGKALVGDAVKEAGKLKSTDLVVIDPPYSGVQYSRFYHVLETLARGSCGPVSGIGRYPAIEERPQSDFSNSGQSRKALAELLSNLSKSGSTVIFTFPVGECSNGLSGDIIHEEAERFFTIAKEIVKGKFSTMGGNNKKDKRMSRKESSELILLMRPK